MILYFLRAVKLILPNDTKLIRKSPLEGSLLSIRESFDNVKSNKRQEVSLKILVRKNKFWHLNPYCNVPVFQIEQNSKPNSKHMKEYFVMYMQCACYVHVIYILCTCDIHVIYM